MKGFIVSSRRMWCSSRGRYEYNMVICDNKNQYKTISQFLRLCKNFHCFEGTEQVIFLWSTALKACAVDFHYSFCSVVAWVRRWWSWARVINSGENINNIKTGSNQTHNEGQDTLHQHHKHHYDQVRYSQLQTLYSGHFWQLRFEWTNYCSYQLIMKWVC